MDGYGNVGGGRGQIVVPNHSLKDLTLHLMSSGSPRRLLPREDTSLPKFIQEPPKTAVLPLPKPMQFGRAKLSPAEHVRRLNTQSCLYCGTASHYVYLSLQET
jgi:hypothetical protein